MKHLLLAGLLVCAGTLNAVASNVPVVVELFTSQGCSSCPPADEMMAVLAEREDVIALSLHVDYWDYIGWKDEFADPGHAKRQRAYAQQAGRRSIYTPEMIVNGESDIVGAKPMKLAMAIDKHKAREVAVVVSATPSGDGTIEVSARADAAGLGPMEVLMVRYQPRRVARITRGENAGRTIEYVNVAQDWRILAEWDGQAPLFVHAPAGTELPVVILVQGRGHGPIFGATRVVFSGN